MSHHPESVLSTYATVIGSLLTKDDQSNKVIALVMKDKDQNLFFHYIKNTDSTTLNYVGNDYKVTYIKYEGRNQVLEIH